MPPPELAGKLPEASPLVMVRPAMVTTEPEMLNARLAALPLTARLAGPGPRVVTLLGTSSPPLISKVVPATADASIESPLLALARAARNVAGPRSAGLVTA